MGLRDLATVLVRLYGLLLLFYCLQDGQGGFIYKIITTSSDPIHRVIFISSVARGILYVVMGVCLLVFAKKIAGWVAPKTSDRFNIIVSTSDLALVSFSLAGIFFFVDGISWLVHDGIAWRLIPNLLENEVRLTVTASLAMSVIKVVVGLFLLFGSRGVLRIIRWTQLEGGYESKPKREEAGDTVELPKILKCPNCGTDYNPKDYSQDVLEWLCPYCKKAMPKE